MISYVISENPDDRVIDRAVSIMRGGGVVAFPTDTNWVLGADINSKAGVESIYKIKKMDRRKHLSLICDSISMADGFSQISTPVYKRIRSLLPGPYTFILLPSNSLPRVIRDYKKEREIGIRIPRSVICAKLVFVLGAPILSSSITCQTLGYEDEGSCNDSDNQQIFSYQIDERLEYLVPLIIDPGDFVFEGESSVIDFSKGDVPIVLREGAGSVAPFII